MMLNQAEWFRQSNYEAPSDIFLNIGFLFRIANRICLANIPGLTTELITLALPDQLFWHFNNTRPVQSELHVILAT